MPGNSGYDMADTARVLYNNYFSVFGFPQRLMSDQGTEFTGDMIAALCKLLGIEKIRTTPYHPQSNDLPRGYTRLYRG